VWLAQHLYVDGETREARVHRAKQLRCAHRLHRFGGRAPAARLVLAPSLASLRGDESEYQIYQRRDPCTDLGRAEAGKSCVTKLHIVSELRKEGSEASS